MNVLFVGFELPLPANSGGRLYMWKRLKYLRSQKHNIYLFCFKEMNELIHQDEYDRYFAEAHFYNRRSNFLSLFANPFIPLVVNSKTNPNIKMDIQQLIQKVKIDLIIIDIPHLIRNCTHVKNIPKILTMHNIEHLVYKRICHKSDNVFLKAIYFVEYLKMVYFEWILYRSSEMQGYVFISPADRRYFATHYGEARSITIPPDVELDDAFRKMPAPNTIVFTGRIDYEPNVQGILWFAKKVLPLIIKKVPNARFYIVGRSPTEKIKTLHDGERIIVTGEVEDTTPYFQMASVVVVPLLSGGGIKVKLLEALAKKCVVVSTRSGIEGTPFQDGIHLLVRDREDEFAEACISVLQNPHRFSRMVTSVQHILAGEYSESLLSQQYNDFLSSFIQASNHTQS